MRSLESCAAKPAIAMEQLGGMCFAEMGIVAQCLRNTVHRFTRAAKACEHTRHDLGIQRTHKPDRSVERRTTIAVQDATNGAAIDARAQRQLGMGKSPRRNPPPEPLAK